MLVGLRRLVRTSGIVMVLGVTESAQGLAQPDPVAVVRIELSEYAFTPARGYTVRTAME